MAAAAAAAAAAAVGLSTMVPVLWVDPTTGLCAPVTLTLREGVAALVRKYGLPLPDLGLLPAGDLGLRARGLQPLKRSATPGVWTGAGGAAGESKAAAAQALAWMVKEGRERVWPVSGLPVVAPPSPEAAAGAAVGAELVSVL